MSCAVLRVVVVLGSPRARGNSATVGSLVESQSREWGAQNGSSVHVDMLDLAAVPVGGCTGCGSCSRTGRCVIEDAMGGYYDLIDRADALVWVTPIYFGSIPSQLKAFVDRFQVFWARRQARATHSIPNPYHARRPGLMVAVRGGGDPFGYDAAIVPIRSASNLAEVTLAEPLIVEGTNERTDMANVEFAGDRRAVADAVDALLDRAADWCAAEPTTHDNRSTWVGFEGGSVA